MWTNLDGQCVRCSQEGPGPPPPSSRWQLWPWLPSFVCTRTYLLQHPSVDWKLMILQGPSRPSAPGLDAETSRLVDWKTPQPAVWAKQVKHRSIGCVPLESPAWYRTVILYLPRQGLITKVPAQPQSWWWSCHRWVPQLRKSLAPVGILWIKYRLASVTLIITESQESVRHVLGCAHVVWNFSGEMRIITHTN